MPNLYWVFQSNVFNDDEQYLLRDPQCNDTAGGGSSESGAQLTCTGPSSVLFDRVIGQDRPQRTELLQYYTWQQTFTPKTQKEMLT